MNQLYDEQFYDQIEERINNLMTLATDKKLPENLHDVLGNDMIVIAYKNLYPKKFDIVVKKALDIIMMLELSLNINNVFVLVLKLFYENELPLVYAKARELFN